MSGPDSYGIPWRPVPPPRPRPKLTFAIFVISVAALMVAIGAWFRPLRDSTPAITAAPTYNEQQVDEAKSKVCAAFSQVDHALDIAGARNGGNDQTAVLAVATSTRQVLEVGSRYLSTKLSEEPSLAPDLQEAVQQLAISWQALAVGYLSGLTDLDAGLQPYLRATDEATSRTRQLCK
jgi:hypothetical protein